MIEITSKQAQLQFSSLLSEVGSTGRRVKIFEGEKVVAEIVPCPDAAYRPHPDPHSAEGAAEGVYLTVGESLKGL